MWCRGVVPWRRFVVVITTAELHLTNPARGVLEIRDGEDPWLEIRIKASAVPLKQFTIIVISLWLWSIFKLLSKKGSLRCYIRKVKICLSKKSWFQRLSVTEHFWKIWTVVSASVWQKENKVDWVLPNWKSFLLK